MQLVKDVNKTLSAWDYVVFAMVLVVSAAIGIYHGCTGGKNRTTGKRSTMVEIYRRTMDLYTTPTVYHSLHLRKQFFVYSANAKCTATVYLLI